MRILRYVSDEQRRRLDKFTRPKGSSEMGDFFVAPPSRVNWTRLRRSTFEIVSFPSFSS